MSNINVSQLITSTTENNIFNYVDRVKDVITEFANDGEENRCVSKAVVDELYKLGLYKLLIPENLGGFDLDVLTAVKFLEQLAQYDGSTAWTLMIGNEINNLIACNAPDEFVEEFFNSDKPAISAGVAFPGGSIEAIEDNQYTITGSWSFGSGCKHASWMLGNCIQMEYGVPVLGDDSNPKLYSVMLPAEKIEIVDTWKTIGLRGTGSHHWKVKCETVDPKYVWPLDGKPRRYSNITEFPGALLLAVTKTCIALGIAKSASVLFREWAMNNQSFGADSYTSEDTGVQMEYAKAVADLEAARSFFYSSIEAIQNAVKPDSYPSDYDISLGHLACVNAGKKAYEVVSALCYLSGASGTIYDDKPLQKKLRDVVTIRGHIAHSNKLYEASGASLLDSNPGEVHHFWNLNYNALEWRKSEA